MSTTHIDRTRLVAPALIGALAVTGALAAGTTATADDGGAFVGSDRCTIAIAHAPLLHGGETGGIVWEAETEAGVVDLDTAQGLLAAEQELAGALARFEAATQEERALTDALIAALIAAGDDAELAELNEQLADARAELEQVRVEHGAAVAEAEQALADARAAEQATEAYQTYQALDDAITPATPRYEPGQSVHLTFSEPVMGYRITQVVRTGEGGGGGGGFSEPTTTVAIAAPAVEGVFEVTAEGATVSPGRFVVADGWTTAAGWYAEQDVPERDAVAVAERALTDAQAARDEAVAAAERAVADAEAAVVGHEANGAFEQAVAAFESVARIPYDEVTAGGLGAITQPALWAEVEAALIGWLGAQRPHDAAAEILDEAYAAAMEAAPFDRHAAFESALALQTSLPAPGGEERGGSIAVTYCSESLPITWTAVEVPDGYAQPDDISVVLTREGPVTDHTGISVSTVELGDVPFSLGESRLGAPFTQEVQLYLPDGLVELPADEPGDEDPGDDAPGTDKDPGDRDGGRDDQGGDRDGSDRAPVVGDGSRDDRSGDRDDIRDGGRDRTGTPTRPDAPVTPPVPSN